MGQIDIWIMLGKIEFEWFSAHAEVLLKAVGRKPSGEGSSVVFHARTLRKPLDILTHRGSLRCSAIICGLPGNATSSMSRFDGIGLLRCEQDPFALLFALA